MSKDKKLAAQHTFQQTSQIDIQKLYNLIKRGLPRAKTADKKKVIPTIGSTGAGKSTSIAYMSEAEMEDTNQNKAGAENFVPKKRYIEEPYIEIQEVVPEKQSLKPNSYILFKEKNDWQLIYINNRSEEMGIEINEVEGLENIITKQQDFFSLPDKGKEVKECILSYHTIYPQVGRGNISKTLYPQVYEGMGGFFYLDLPGFEDNRENEKNNKKKDKNRGKKNQNEEKIIEDLNYTRICASIMTEFAIGAAESIAAIAVVIEYGAFTVERAVSFSKLVVILSKLLDFNSIDEIAPSILFFITKVPFFKKGGEIRQANREDILALISNEIDRLSKKTTDKVNIEKQLKILHLMKKDPEKIFVINPDDKGKSGEEVTKYLQNVPVLRKGIFDFNGYDHDRRKFIEFIRITAYENLQVIKDNIELSDFIHINKEQLDIIRNIKQVNIVSPTTLVSTEENPVIESEKLIAQLKQQIKENQKQIRIRKLRLKGFYVGFEEKISRLNKPNGYILSKQNGEWKLVEMRNHGEKKYIEIKSVPNLIDALKKLPDEDVSLFSDEDVSPIEKIIENYHQAMRTWPRNAKYVSRPHDPLERRVEALRGELKDLETDDPEKITSEEICERRVPILGWFGGRTVKRFVYNILSEDGKKALPFLFYREKATTGEFSSSERDTDGMSSKAYNDNQERKVLGTYYNAVYRSKIGQSGIASVEFYVRRRDIPENARRIRLLKMDGKSKEYDENGLPNSVVTLFDLFNKELADLEEKNNINRKLISNLGLNNSDKKRILEQAKASFEKSLTDQKEQEKKLEDILQKAQGKLNFQEGRYGKKRSFFLLIKEIYEKTRINFDSRTVTEFLAFLNVLEDKRSNKSTENIGQIEPTKVPSMFKCFLTKNIMIDPAETICEHTFEYNAITRFLSDKRKEKNYKKEEGVECPYPDCKKRIKETDLLPRNATLRQAINQWREENQAYASWDIVDLVLSKEDQLSLEEIEKLKTRKKEIKKELEILESQKEKLDMEKKQIIAKLQEHKKSSLPIPPPLASEKISEIGLLAKPKAKPYEGREVHAALLGLITKKDQRGSAFVFDLPMTKNLFIDSFQRNAKARLSEEGLYIVILQIHTNHWVAVLIDNLHDGQKISYIDPTGAEIEEDLKLVLQQQFPSVTIESSKIDFQVTGIKISKAESKEDYVIGDIVNCGVWLVKLIGLYLSKSPHQLPTNQDLVPDSDKPFDIADERERQKAWITNITYKSEAEKLENDLLVESRVVEGSTEKLTMI